MKQLSPIVAALLAFALLMPAATAQEAPDEEALARAYELNEQGFVAFEEGRYADAARAFAEAWTFSRDETLRKNEALAWFRAGECDPAVEAANKFLMLDGIEEVDRTDIHSVIANCKVEFAHRAIDAGDLQLADTMLTEAEALDPDAVARDKIASARVELAAARRAVAEAEAEPPPEPEVRTVYVPEPPQPDPPILGYSLIGGGGAIVIGTVVYHLVALGWQNSFLDMVGSPATEEATQRFESLRKRVHTARVLVPILYGVGALTAGAGVTLVFFVEPASPSANSQQAGPMTFGVRGSF